MVTFADIEVARQRIGGAIYESPCAYTESLSRLTHNRLFLKLENLQMTGSFKERGALNRLLLLAEAERKKGVVAASAGNHAQGVAYHCGRLRIHATIVMPEATPLIKIDSTRAFGAEVILHGTNYDEAATRAGEIAHESGATYVHPFDDVAVIAGQGTIGLELLEQNPYLEVVICPVGGGGLISGIAVAIKEVNPRIQIIGVEASAIASMRAALDARSIVTLAAATSIADGIAVRTAGAHTFPLVSKYVDDIVTVSEEEIANAILLLLEREKTVAEGAGATPLAALVHGKLPKLVDKRVVLIVSGGNIDVNLMSRIIERGLVKSGRLMRLRVPIRDRAGVLADVTALIAKTKANILQVMHHRSFGGIALGQVVVELDLETRGFDHIAEIETALRQRGYEVSVAGPTPDA